MFHTFISLTMHLLVSDILNPVTEHGKVLDEFFISTAGRLKSFDVS